jgi:HKD family nuclease
MIKTIQDGWLKAFCSELRGVQTVRIVSPFITDNVVRHLLKDFEGNKLQVITRFNLNDFRSRVSSLTALKRLVEAGAEIKGIKGLHSKLYLFDSTTAIIASANFTNGGFFKNQEFGIKTDDGTIVNQSLQYFQDLWSVDKYQLKNSRIEEWDNEIKTTGKHPEKPSLADYGKSKAEQIIQKKRYFIKFFGKSEHREPLTYRVRSEIESGCCHYALSFSRKKDDRRPRKYRDGDIVYMAKMTDTHDYAIFGKGTTYAHNDTRDIAGPDDQNQVEWIYDWPILVRVRDTEFIDATLADCPKMSGLIEELDYESFHKTYERYLNGETDIMPYRSLQQKADIRLSDLSALWLEDQFNQTINQKGRVPVSFIQQFYQGIKL